jgi:hypothetical protein
MTVYERLDRRWHEEILGLEEMAAGSDGRLRIESATSISVRINIACRSAFKNGDSPVEICDCRHSIRLFRNESWPAIPVAAVHISPKGIWHPNILAPHDARLSGQGDPVVAALEMVSSLGIGGAICWGYGRRPQLALSDIVQHLYNIVGYRFNAFSRSGSHLNPASVRWVNERLQQDPSFFPLERRPLLPGGAGNL